jgi:hypothetical protein
VETNPENVIELAPIPEELATNVDLLFPTLKAQVGNALAFLQQFALASKLPTLPIGWRQGNLAN